MTSLRKEVTMGAGDGGRLIFTPRIPQFSAGSDRPWLPFQGWAWAVGAELCNTNKKLIKIS